MEEEFPLQLTLFFLVSTFVVVASFGFLLSAVILLD
jgi:hypothetical protein